jgi:uncharacterized membrane protein YdcZ (DUF606 family)
MLADLIKANAKAIAVPVAALVIWAARAIADNAGVDVTLDNKAVEKAIGVAVVAVAVWFTRNRAKPAPE